MEIASEIAHIEAELSAGGHTVKALCARAEVNQSTWTRWKNGATEPNTATWRKVKAAFADLVSPPARAS